MIKKLLSCVREYKKLSILTFLLMIGEVAIECMIPFRTANLVNQMQGGLELRSLLLTGLTLVCMAILSLTFGSLAGYTSAKASAGFAKNLRNDIFDQIRSFISDPKFFRLFVLHIKALVELIDRIL